MDADVLEEALDHVAQRVGLARGATAASASLLDVSRVRAIMTFIRAIT